MMQPETIEQYAAENRALKERIALLERRLRMDQGPALADHNSAVNAAPVELCQSDFDNVVSFDGFKAKQNAPDANLVFMDDNGAMWFTYGVDYIDTEGRKMSFHFWAKSFADANERLAQIKINGCVYGQILSDNIPL